ncbi:MAG: RNA 3'-terminal phosphate cyclase [Alphaproteobacteria bacterium]|nr:RNA 3'-terminal phosphate cyclase [Alphaproteobacteria bacterium]
MAGLLVIDGAFGEGGGQVVRTSLALSVITGRPIRIENIRAGRKKPGLLRQHLTGVRAAAEISDAEVEGAELGSRALTFRPGPRIRPGTYRFAVGSAGSANLVLQTVLPALVLADAPSTVVLEGGTHNMKSPPHGFLAKAFLPQLARFGPRVELSLDRWGFYPAGGGQMTATITPAALRKGFDLTERRDPVELTAVGVVSNLPPNIARRELKVVQRKLKLDEAQTRIESVGGPGPGNVVWIEANAGKVTEVFTGFGQKGVTAEQVAERTVREAKRWLEAGAPVGEHLADQLLIPMALAGSGRFTTVKPTLHTLTNMAVIERFLPARFASEESSGRWTISVAD